MSNYLSKILLLLPALFFFIVFSSLGLYWSSYPYDAWRIYEVIVLILFTFYLIYFLSINKYSLFKKQNSHKLFFILSITITILIIVTILYSRIPERAISDITLYILLINFMLISSYLFRIHRHFSENITALIAILPMLTLIFLPISIWDRLHGGDGVWTQSFTNIRMLDDALLPCLFLLWLQPAWLSPKKYSTLLRKTLITTLVYIVSTIYLLSFLFHGARAGLLAISIGLIISIFLTLKSKQDFLKIPLISCFTSIILFNIYHFISPNNIGSSVARMSSSGRIELWQKALHIWLENPILGIGGNHFSLEKPFLISTHPHNLFLRFLTEWGVITFVILFIIFIIFKKIYRHKNSIPTLLIAGIFAVIINSLLSGSFVYPASQLINFWFFALMLSYLPTYEIKDNSFYFGYQKKIWISISILVVVGIICIYGQDILCYPCISIDEYGAPGFWDQGRAIHLSPLSDLKDISQQK